MIFLENKQTFSSDVDESDEVNNTKEHRKGGKLNHFIKLLLIEFVNDCYSKFIKSFEANIMASEFDKIMNYFIEKLSKRFSYSIQEEDDDLQRIESLKSFKSELQFLLSTEGNKRGDFNEKLETIRRTNIILDSNDFIKKYFVITDSSTSFETSKNEDNNEHSLARKSVTITLYRFCMNLMNHGNMMPILLLLSTLKLASIHNIEDKISMQFNVGHSRKWLEFGTFCDALF